MGKIKSFIYGFTIGGVVAGATVLLSTPKSGKEMRQDIKQQVNDAKLPIREVKSAAISVKNSINDFTQKRIPIIKSTVSDVKTLVDSWQQDIEPNIKKISEEIDHLEIKN